MSTASCATRSESVIGPCCLPPPFKNFENARIPRAGELRRRSHRLVSRATRSRKSGRAGSSLQHAGVIDMTCGRTPDVRGPWDLQPCARGAVEVVIATCKAPVDVDARGAGRRSDAKWLDRASTIDSALTTIKTGCAELGALKNQRKKIVCCMCPFRSIILRVRTRDRPHPSYHVLRASTGAESPFGSSASAKCCRRTHVSPRIGLVC